MLLRSLSEGALTPPDISIPPYPHLRLFDLEAGDCLYAFKQESEANRVKGITLANEICLKYRREGRFFDDKELCVERIS